MEGKKLSESQCVHLSSFLFSCLGQNKTGKRPTWIWPRVLLYVPPRHWKSAWVMGHRDPRVTSWVTAWVTYLCHCFSHLLGSSLGSLTCVTASVTYLCHRLGRLNTWFITWVITLESYVSRLHFYGKRDLSADLKDYSRSDPRSDQFGDPRTDQSGDPRSDPRKTTDIKKVLGSWGHCDPRVTGRNAPANFYSIVLSAIV